MKFLKGSGKDRKGNYKNRGRLVYEKKSVVVLLTVTMVTEMTATGCGDKQLALATDRVSVELGYELNTDVAAYVADADIAVETTIDFGAVDVSKLGTYSGSGYL